MTVTPQHALPDEDTASIGVDQSPDGVLDGSFDDAQLGTEVLVASAAAGGGGQTTLPKRPAGSGAGRARRSISGVRLSDVMAAVGAALAALATTIMLYVQLLPFNGKLGFAVLAYVLYLGYYALLVSMDEDWAAVRDRFASAVLHSLAFVLLCALVLVVVFPFFRGYKALIHWNFFTSDLSGVGGLMALDKGGVLHGVTGTLIELSIALTITVPLGLLCAVFMHEIPGPFSRLVRTVVEAMTALPSIVAGLFIYATAILIFGMPRSGLAAGLAISLMMMPIVIRAADVVLRLVPGTLKEAALALGSTQWRAAWHILLPTARPGLATAIILGTARGVGETSPVLLTAGYTDTVNLDPSQNPMVSLPLMTYKLVQSTSEFNVSRGFGAACVLLILVSTLFVLARLLGGRGAGQLTKRQLGRRARQSARDLARYDRRYGYGVVTPPAGTEVSSLVTEGN